jgi:L-iditol 2-dehydrogenase
LEGRPESCRLREDIGFSYNGGFEEYMVISAKLLSKKISPVISVPKNVPLYMAAIAEPFACALHSHKKLIRSGKWNRDNGVYEVIQGIVEGDIVVVIGGGPLGCMHAELAKSYGANEVVIAQHSEDRLKTIKMLEVADYYVLNKSEEELRESINSITDGRGADVVITATSNPTSQVQALKIARQGGVISFFGGVNKNMVEIPTNKVHYNGPVITGTSGASPYHIPIVLNLLDEGKIDGTKYITHLLGLHHLEKILLTKGIPSFSSLPNILNIKGESYFDFLYVRNFGLENNKILSEKLKAFKSSILKALVVPSLQPEKGITPLDKTPLEERRKRLNDFVE